MSLPRTVKIGLILAGIILLGYLLFLGAFSIMNELRGPAVTERKTSESKTPAKSDFTVKKGEQIDVEQLKQSDWYKGVMDQIETDQRQIIQDKERGVLIAYTPLYGLKTEFDKNGAALMYLPLPPKEEKPDASEEPGEPAEPQEPAPPVTIFKYKLNSLTIDGQATQMPEIDPAYKGIEVTYNRNGITEIYENNKEGIEQKFIIHDPLSKSQRARKDIETRLAPILRRLGFKPAEESYNIIIEAGLDTELIARQEPQGVAFFDGGKRILNYRTPPAQDAKGKKLFSRFDYHKGTLKAIVAVTQDTRYPIYVGVWAKNKDVK